MPGEYVPLNKAKQGDLLFYASDVTKPSTVYHVAMYIGGGKLLDSPQTGENVRVDPLWTTDLMPVVVRPVAGLKLPVKLGATGMDGDPAAAGPESPRRGADRRWRIRAGHRDGRPGLAAGAPAHGDRRRARLYLADPEVDDGVSAPGT